MGKKKTYLCGTFVTVSGDFLMKLGRQGYLEHRASPNGMAQRSHESHNKPKYIRLHVQLL